MNLADLCKQIDQASQSYYTPKGKKIISDAQYDSLIARLREIDPTNERLTRVGPPYSPDELRTKVAHKIPMGSLDNTPGGLEGFAPWYDKVCATLGTGVMLNASFKMDGFSVELDYVDGKLAKAVTRGNGEVGDDVTANAVRWQQVPTLLPEPLTCTVRGEGVLFIADFEELRQQAAERGEDVSNPRNLGTGMSGRSDGEGNERLRFFAFNVLRNGSVGLTDDLNWLEGLGFVPVKHILTSDKNKIINLYDAMQGGGRAKLPFEIDGIVVCVDNRAQQQALLTTPRSALRPPYARAIKFETMKARTKVVDILLTVGKTGKIVPTALLEPVKIGGVTVDSALLNNWNPQSENPSAADVSKGDLVEVERAGDVIPKCIAVIEKASDGTILSEPEVCPVCGAPTTHWRRNKEVKDVYCSKPATCPAAALCRIDGYIGDSKRGVGILGIGDSVLAALTDSEDGEAPLVSSPADLYRLTAEQISPLTIGYSSTNSPIRLGNTRANAIIEQINKARKIPLAKFLGSLDVDLLGRRRVEQLAVNPALTTIEGWLDENNLLSIPGDTIRKSIIDGMNQKRALILELLLFVTVEPIVLQAAAADAAILPMASLSFCFTGTRECLDEVKKLGAEIKSGVSKGLTYLVQGRPDSVSNKTQRAEELGVKIISIGTLREVLAGTRELP